MGKSEDLLNAKEGTSDLNLARNQDELDEKNSESEDNLPIITFRSILVGVIISAFGATCAQVSAQTS
jgi:hypothetical protein